MMNRAIDAARCGDAAALEEALAALGMRKDRGETSARWLTLNFPLPLIQQNLLRVSARSEKYAAEKKPVDLPGLIIAACRQNWARWTPAPPPPPPAPVPAPAQVEVRYAVAAVTQDIIRALPNLETDFVAEIERTNPFAHELHQESGLAGRILSNTFLAFCGEKYPALVREIIVRHTIPAPEVA